MPQVSSLQNQIELLKDQIQDKLVDNPLLNKSVFGVFKDAHSECFNVNNSHDTAETIKLKHHIIQDAFKESKILKKPIDRVILLCNMPKQLLHDLYIPTLISAPTTGQFPKISKFVQYFERHNVPNLILMQIRLKGDK